MVVRNSFPLARARNETRETNVRESIIARLLFAIRGASRGANALWSHTFAHAKSSFFLTGAEERKESNREERIHRPKKKEKSTEIRAL
jgi:hypothetical protein|tara:strand:- start:453 stop:716 length:264 start_codon:yes stop_codon:yes gene_type:complete